MKTNLLKLFIPVIIFFISGITSCSSDNGTSNRDIKDKDKNENHAVDPRLPSDAEYPGSEVYDSLRADSMHHK